MKSLLYLFLFIFLIPANAQKSNNFKQRINNPIKFQINFAAGSNFANGNGFYKDTYDPQIIGFHTDLKLGLKDFFGLGANFFINENKVVNQTLLGNFSRMTYEHYVIFIYYEHFIAEKWMLEGRIGFGESRLNHPDSQSSNGYRLNFNNFQTGFGGRYKWGNQISVISGVHINFLKSNGLKVNRAFEDYFQKANLFQFYLGLGFHL